MVATLVAVACFGAMQEERSYLRSQAERCERLAKFTTDDATRDALRRLAQDYLERARRWEAETRESAKRSEDATSAEAKMTDDSTNIGSPDRDRIAMGEEHEVRYWTEALGVTKERLQQAVDSVGNSVEKVRAHLRD